MTNQYAAMPSLHVGWSLWCGILLWRHGRHPLIRTAGIAYPLITTIVVMGTANHYFLDAVAGAAVMGLGALLVKPVIRFADGVKARLTGVLPDGLPGSRKQGGASTAAAAIPATVSPDVSAGCKTSTGERIPGQRTTSADPPGTAVGGTAVVGPAARDAADADASDDAPAAAR